MQIDVAHSQPLFTSKYAMHTIHILQPFYNNSLHEAKQKQLIFSIFFIFSFPFNKKINYFQSFPFLYLCLLFTMYDLGKIKDKNKKNYHKKDICFTFLYVTFKKTKIHDQCWPKGKTKEIAQRKKRNIISFTSFLFSFPENGHRISIFSPFAYILFSFEETKAKCKTAVTQKDNALNNAKR